MVSPSLLPPRPFTFHPDPLYPDSDGRPIAENTLQYSWIALLMGNLEALFRDRPDVFVAADLLWYPVEGEPQTRLAPDVMVAFGRPKGYRGSYKQWEEDGVPFHVVFEVLSPGNTTQEMIDKFHFYEEFGVQEYYVIDPDHNRLEAYHRGEATLRRVEGRDEVVSPRLGIRFRPVEGELRVYGPDGEVFTPHERVIAERNTALREADQARSEAQQARSEAQQARRDAERARSERDNARGEADEARQRAARLAERLRQLGLDPDA